jgi:hypothetical protein
MILKRRRKKMLKRIQVSGKLLLCIKMLFFIFKDIKKEKKFFDTMLPNDLKA